MALRLALAFFVVLVPGGQACWADAPDVLYCRQQSFRIPFEIDAKEQGRLKEVQLYVSDDQNRAWKLHKTVAADQRSFPFRAERDGTYCFLVRTIDKDGRAFPANVDQGTPGLKVCVDTQPPQVLLRALPPRQDQVGFEWEIRDDALDLHTLVVDYQGQGGNDWQPVTIDPMPSGQRYFTPSGRGPFELRLRVRDRADNQGIGHVALGQGGKTYGEATNRRDDNFGQALRGNQGESSRNPRIVNSAEMSLSYSLEEVGPSGVSVVELYVTKDGRTWQKHGEDEDKQSPFNVKLPGEGVYGLTLVVKSGVGMGDRPPQTGDPPQLWVEVDLTKPTVGILAVDPAKGSDGNLLTILWKAEDKNLAPQPITISYAEATDGPWQPIVSGIENVGRYVWRIPPATPFKFFVRVEAADRGGNVGRAETNKQVVVDLSQPKGRLLGVDGK